MHNIVFSLLKNGREHSFTLLRRKGLESIYCHTLAICILVYMHLYSCILFLAVLYFSFRVVFVLAFSNCCYLASSLYAFNMICIKACFVRFQSRIHV